MKGYPGDFAVGHGVVLEGEPAVGEHELGVVLLCALDAPWWVDEHHIKLAHLLHKQSPVEVAHVAVDVGVTEYFICLLPRLFLHFECLQVLYASLS